MRKPKNKLKVSRQKRHRQKRGLADGDEDPALRENVKRIGEGKNE
jgi:hypothetical protein